MRIPNSMQDAGKKRLERYLAGRLQDSDTYHYDPSRSYNLLVREPHEVPDDHPEYSDSPGTGLLKRDEHWERVTPLRKLKFPRRKHASRKQLALEDMTEDKFKAWFEDNFSDLPDGVYGAVKRVGKAQGYATLFVLELSGGKVSKFQKKSRSQHGKGEGEASRYFAFPWYFDKRSTLNI